MYCLYGKVMWLSLCMDVPARGSSYFQVVTTFYSRLACRASQHDAFSEPSMVMQQLCCYIREGAAQRYTGSHVQNTVYSECNLEVLMKPVYLYSLKFSEHYFFFVAD
uniref:Putative secreted protein n=1 Tax=Ixodes ricinus TaxID=34613 RepID=A0A6B0UC02_IXORI